MSTRQMHQNAELSAQKNTIKSLIAAAVLLICAVLFFTSRSIDFEYNHRMSIIYREEANLLLAFEQSVRRDFNGAEEILKELTREYAENGESSQKLVEHLQYTRSLPLVHVSIANKNGIIKHSTVPQLISMDISNGEYYQHFRYNDEGKTYFAKPVIGRQTNNWIFHMSRRLNNTDGSFAGTATVGINPEYFGEFYRKMQLGKGFSISLIGLDGFVRVRQTDEKMDVGADVRNSKIFSLIKEKRSDKFSDMSAADKLNRIYSYRVMNNYPFVLVIAVLEADALSEFYASRQEHLLVALIGIMGIMAFFALLIRMVKQKEETERILLQKNVELEHKVAERTLDLSKTNIELKSSQERYHALMDQSFEGLALIDIQTLEVVEVNRRFTEMFGYSLPENAPFFVNKFSIDSEETLHKRYTALKDQRVFQIETRKYIHKNGSAVFAERAGTYIEINGKDYLLSSLRDVTTERRRQKELQQDVEFASRVQKELLPEMVESPFVTNRTIYVPSNLVSGDSYFMEWRNDGKLLRGFLIDITGHGLATALQTSSINALLRETSTANLTLMEQLQQINSRAAKYFSEGSYASLIGFELDFSDLELRYIAAGITQFYFNGIKTMTPGMFVGMLENAEFIAGANSLSEGDCIHFLTDGFTDRLSQPNNTNFWSPGGKDFDADVAALEELASKGDLRDDATGLCFRINGKKLQ